MPRQLRIEQILQRALAPTHLEVIDESHRHSVPAGAESHFKVLAISASFAGETLLKRHRRVNALLRAEFDTGLHALAIRAWTPEEWFERGAAASASPPCLGGARAATA